MNKVEEFIFEIRNSADIIYNIFTKGSCFRLYKILKCAFPKAIPFWSDTDKHCITKIGNDYYDIGGKIYKNWIEDKGYYKISDNLINGFYLLRYTETEESHTYIITEKYRD
jgi:hypothetical protein